MKVMGENTCVSHYLMSHNISFTTYISIYIMPCDTFYCKGGIQLIRLCGMFLTNFHTDVYLILCCFFVMSHYFSTI